MSEENRAPSPDQNDPTGHTREGSPTYHEGSWPANSHQPVENRRPPASNDREARDRNAVGSVEQPAGETPNIPEPTPAIHQGAPD